MSTFFKPTTLVGAISWVIFSGQAWAQQAQTLPTTAKTTPNTDLQKLAPLVITASRDVQALSQAAARVTVIDQASIEQSQVNSLPDLLKKDASLNVVQSGGLGQQTSVFTRGANSAQTLLLKDGVRLNSTTAGIASYAFLDTSDIARIEILKGPASVLYGTDAIGGVIQLISQTPEKTAAFVTAELAENNTYKAIVGADLFEDGIYAQVRSQRLESDGTPVKETATAQNAPFEQQGFSGKFGVKRENFAASLDYSQNTGNNVYDNFGSLANQDFKNEVINLKGQATFGLIEVHSRLSQFVDNIEQNNSQDFVHSKAQEAEIYTVSNISPQQQILLGATYRNNKADVLNFGTAIDQAIHTTGYYLQHQLNNDLLSTQVGVRLEDNELFGKHTVGQAAIRYFILPSTSIYTNIGSAFRAPNFNELYAFGGNTELNPEKSRSIELGLDHQLLPSLKLGLNAYRNNVDELINFTATGNENIDKAKLEGGELALNWQWSDWFVNLAYHYVKAQNAKTNVDLSRRPRQKMNLAAGYTQSQYGVSMALQAVSDSDNSAFDTRQIPGYFSADFNSYYNINPNLKLFVNVANVGDVKYRTAFGSGSFFINPGRVASVGLTVRY